MVVILKIKHGEGREKKLKLEFPCDLVIPLLVYMQKNLSRGEVYLSVEILACM